MISHLQATIEFFKELRPAFVLPSRRALATTLLLASFRKVASEVHKHLDGRMLSITSDGWQRKQGGVHVINFCAATHGSSLILDMRTCHGDVLGGMLFFQKFVDSYSMFC